jgi:hypothetical protein
MYVSGGVDISKLTIDGLSNNVFKASSSPLIGLGVDISSPRLNDRLFLTLGAFYLEKEYVGYEEEISYNTRRSDYLIPISFLKFPVGCRYNFFHESKTPYVKIGLVQFMVLTSSVEVLSEYEAAGVVTTEFTKSELDASNQMGFWFAAGFSKTIRNRIKGFAEFRYERGNGFLGSQFLGDSPSATANVNVLIGLSF